MLLTSENYYSTEADKEYLSVSQYKNFVGSLGRPGCEAYALAKLNEEWVENMEDSDALMVGSYVDAHFEGRLALAFCCCSTCCCLFCLNVAIAWLTSSSDSPCCWK